jgi:hypothetical protein
LATHGDAVLAYPAGVGRSWNARTGCCATAGRLHVDDVGFLRALIPAIEAHAPVTARPSPAPSVRRSLNCDRATPVTYQVTTLPTGLSRAAAVAHVRLKRRALR